MTELEKMIRGEEYDHSDPELRQLHRKASRILWEFNQTHPDDREIRENLLKSLFGQWVKGYIDPPFHCDYGINIKFKGQFYANTGCVILDSAPVTIGDTVLFGPHVQLYTVGHPIDPVRRAAETEFAKPITIGDNVWIGGGTIICPGVTIGTNTTIGAGSVVTRDIPVSVVAVGNPCRVIKKVETPDKVLNEIVN